MIILAALAASLTSTAQRKVNYDESAVAPYSLEDPLVFANGKKVRSKAQWPARREEILGIFQREMYGIMPPKGDGIFLDTIEEGTTLAGFGTRRQVRMWFRPDKTGPKLDWLIVLPKHTKGPVPTVLLLNYSGNHEFLIDEEVLVTDSWMRGAERNNHASVDTRGLYARDGGDNVYPVGMLVARGYAVVTCCYCPSSEDVGLYGGIRPLGRA